MSTRSRLVLALALLCAAATPAAAGDWFVGKARADGPVNGGGGSITSGTTPISGCATTGGILFNSTGKVACSTAFIASGSVNIGQSGALWLSSSTAVQVAQEDVTPGSTMFRIRDGSGNFSILSESAGVISAGTVPVGNTGTCATGVTVAGGATAGTWTSTAICAIAGTIILSSMIASNTGWVCDANDRTTAGVVLQQTASSTTSATFTVRTTATVASDVISYKCTGY